MALAAATAVVPVMAHAGVGDSASLVVDPVVISSASASATTACPAGNLGCYLVEGAVVGTQTLVRGTVIYIGTIAYVAVEGTAQLFKLIGSALPGPIGDFFTNVGDGVSAFGATIGQTFHVGPYLSGA
jgi:hypothetical protein